MDIEGLPHIVSGRLSQESTLRSIQQNFDHIQGVLRALATALPELNTDTPVRASALKRDSVVQTPLYLTGVTADPATPPTGQAVLFYRVDTQELKVKHDDGTVTTL